MSDLVIEYIQRVIAVLVLGAAGIAIVLLFISILFDTYFKRLNYYLYDMTGFSLRNRIEFNLFPLPEEKTSIIFRHSSFYRNLSHYQKRKFGCRVRKFISKKHFIGRGGFAITEDIELLIASQAVMLSFGMRDYLLPGFEKIFVYPQEYFSNITGKRHKGEVNPGGAIVLSWNNFTVGIDDENDNYNLGLHEFAHAYFLQAEQDDVYGEVSMITRLDRWYSLYNNQDYRQELQAHNALREYAFTNYLEFFAVSVEYFFETPETFRQNAPYLYGLLTEMLNQNPLKQGR